MLSKLILQKSKESKILVDKSVNSSTQTEPKNYHQGYLRKIFEQDWDQLIAKTNYRYHMCLDLIFNSNDKTYVNLNSIYPNC